MYSYWICINYVIMWFKLLVSIVVYLISLWNCFYRRKSEQFITPPTSTNKKNGQTGENPSWGLHCCWTWGCGSQHVIFHTWFDGPTQKNRHFTWVFPGKCWCLFWEGDLKWKHEDNQNDRWILILIDIFSWMKETLCSWISSLTFKHSKRLF